MRDVLAQLVERDHVVSCDVVESLAYRVERVLVVAGERCGPGHAVRFASARSATMTLCDRPALLCVTAIMDVVWDTCFMTTADPTGEMDDLLARISVDPAICGGKPCVRGTRIWVGLVLGALAHGASVDELLAEYPQLDELDIRACLAFGAAMANGRLIDLPGAAHPAA